MRHAVVPLSCVFLVICVLGPADVATAQWRRMGLPMRDLALCVTPVPGTGAADTVYVGTYAWENDGGGVWMSTDGGATWTARNGGPDGIPPYREVSRLEIDPADHGHILAGSYGGIHQSFDGGVSWTYIPVGGIPSRVAGLLLDAANPANYLVDLRTDGLFRSTDQGGSWVEKISLASGGNIVQHPVQPDIIFTVIQSQIYVSEDSGDTWEERAGLPAASIAIRPSPPYDLVAATSDGVFRSTDGGFTWQPAGPGSPVARTIMAGTDSLLIAAGNGGLFRSTDDGFSWEELDPVFRSAGVSEIVSDPGVPGRIWVAASVTGVYRSDDDGASWQHLTVGADTAEVISLAIPAWDPSTLFAGSASHIGRTGDLGETWKTHAGGDISGVQVYEKLAFHPLDSSLVLTGQESLLMQGVIQRSTDGGRSWTIVLAGASDSFFSDVVFHPARPGTAFTFLDGTSGDQNVCSRSTDSGLTWEDMDVLDYITGVMFAFDPFDADRIFLAGANTSGGAVVLRTTDGSASWQAADEGLPEGAAVAALGPSPAGRNVWYLALEGSEGPVYRSTDGGSSWSPAGTICAGGCGVRDMIAHPRDRDALYAVTDSGVFLSRDGGESWEEDNDGIDPAADFSSIVVDSTVRNKLIVGGGYGWEGSPWLYERDLDPVGVEEPGGGPDRGVPAAFSLSQNYPNPFNPQTTIPFDVPGGRGKKQEVLVRIYDLRGRLVKTLVDRELEPGSHRVVWDGRDYRGRRVASGVYFTTLKSGGETFVRKMVVLR